MTCPICFVLMPFGNKPDPTGGPDIAFDRIYDVGIRPAILEAGLEPLRADAEIQGGIIHKAMYERLLMCDYAVADLTTSNANVFYELGIRHAMRPASTVSVIAGNHPIPFDIHMLRSIRYELGPGSTFSEEAAQDLRTRLRAALLSVKDEPKEDSPLFRLLDGYPAPDLARLKTDVFLDAVSHENGILERLKDVRHKAKRGAEERKRGLASLDAVVEEIGDLRHAASGVLIGLLLSYRALGNEDGFRAIRDLYEKFPPPLKRSVLAREQLAFALNRLGAHDQAVDVLESVLDDQGPSPETCGLMGRIYKDLWEKFLVAGKPIVAAGHLTRAIDCYLQGFETDWRDAFPGINAATLLELAGTDEAKEKQQEILPVIEYSIRQRLRSSPDYWDHAAMLEVDVLAGRPDAALGRLGMALAAPFEPWMPRTTARNLRLIYERRRENGEDQPWLNDLLAELEEAGR